MRPVYRRRLNALLAALRAELPGLEPYRIEHPGRPGLIFGYATLDEATIRRGVGLLAEAVHARAAA